MHVLYIHYIYTYVKVSYVYISVMYIHTCVLSCHTGTYIGVSYIYICLQVDRSRSMIRASASANITKASESLASNPSHVRYDTIHAINPLLYMI